MEIERRTLADPAVSEPAHYIPADIKLAENMHWNKETLMAAKLPLALGTNEQGYPVIEGLSNLQHLLIGGSEEEKDRILRVFIVSIISRAGPNEARFLIIGSQLESCNMLPHLLYPVLAYPDRAVCVMRYLLREIEHRYRTRALIEAEGRSPGTSLPAIVCIVNELAELRSSNREEAKQTIARIARFGHEVGIHLILATSQVSRQVVTSSIKANIPARLAFRLESQSESRVLIDLPGAESLSGTGGALFTHTETSETIRLHTPTISDQEFQSIIRETREKNGAPVFIADNELFAASSENNNYIFPPIDLLAIPSTHDDSQSQQECKQTMERLLQTLEQFNIKAQADRITRGPVITRYEVKPALGVRVERIGNLDKNIAMALMAESVRILAPVPGCGTVGIEIPNRKPQAVRMREIIESSVWIDSKAQIPIVLGKDVTGRPIVEDLTRMPHMLIAGSTNSGKTVCINAIIASLLYRASPDTLRFIMIDPKVVEMQEYNALPHMLIPVVTDPKKVPGALQYLLNEMERRYQLFAGAGVRNIVSFNRKQASASAAATMSYKKRGQKLPYIVCIIDELADLMMVAPQDIETGIARLAQLARAAGIHLILATQRPSANVITGVIKANLPTRIAFNTASKIDSRIILDSAGAESLLGRGDMLFTPPGSSHMVRAQGAFIDEDEIQSIITCIQDKNGLPQYAADVQASIDAFHENSTVADAKDELMPQAIQIIRTHRRASISLLQRKLRIGYNRAARIMDELRESGVVLDNNNPDMDGQ